MRDAVHASEPAQTGVATLFAYRHFVIAAILYLFLCQCAVLFFAVPKAVGGSADFRSFYTAGFLVRSGAAGHLYDLALQQKMQEQLVSGNGVLPFLYPAFGALPFVPLSWLSFRAAYWVFFAFNLALLGLSAHLLRPSLPHLAELWRPLPFVVFFCFFPAAEALMQGQSSFLLLALYCAAFAQLEKGRPALAGLFVGLAVLKFQIALPIALLLLFWRRWRAAAGFAAGAAAALLVSLCVTGYSTFVQYWQTLLLAGASSSATTPTLRMLPALMPNLYGIAEVVAKGAPWGARSSAAVSLLLFFWIASRPRPLPTAIITALLISRYLGMHDLVLLLPAVALALDYVAAHPRERRAQFTGILALILLFPPVYLFALGHHLVDLLAIVLLLFLVSCTLVQQEPSTALLAPAEQALSSEV